MKIAPRFTGLKLRADDRAELLKMQRGQKPLTPRRWRRIRVLLLLDGGHSVRATATAVGGYHREVSRVGKRYLQGGLAKALSDEPRPKPAPMLDSTQQAALVALVCGPPPEGRARWTVRVLAEEASRRGVVDKIGRETVRIVLARHDLKPWREKNVVRAPDRRRIRGAHGGRP
jgi:putative transposase